MNTKATGHEPSVKVITDYEIADIIQRAIRHSELDDADTHSEFVADLANAVTKYFGGVLRNVTAPDRVLNAFAAHIERDENILPENIYNKYDPDVYWGDETNKPRSSQL